MYDKEREKIVELLGYGLSIRKIARFLGYGNHASLNYSINRRHLQQEADTLRVKQASVQGVTVRSDCLTVSCSE
jgi:hypothetical protein